MRHLVPVFILLLVAPRVHALGGRVVSPDGVPLAGVTVSAVRVPPDWRPLPFPDEAAREHPVLGTAVTGADGAFALDASSWPASHPALRVSGEGLATVTFAEFRVAVPGAALPSGLELAAVAAVSLEGIVLDERGAPAGGLRVGAVARSWEGWSLASTVTGPDGSFAFRSLPGLASVGVVAQRADGLVARAGTWLPESGSARIALHVPDGLPATGQLLTLEKGATKPVAGARLVVTATSWSSEHGHGASWLLGSAVLREATTDAEGRFRVLVPHGSSTWLVQPGFALAELSAGRQVVDSLPWTTGTVSDATGRPLPGARVTGEQDALTATSDAAGRFALPRQAQRGSDRLTVHEDGLLGGRSFARRAHARPVRVSLSRGATSGVVREAPAADGTPGAPVAGALVSLRAGSGPLLITASDSHGRWSVAGLASGLVRASATKDGRSGAASGGGGALPDVVLGPLESRELRAVETEGDGTKPVASAWILARPATGADLPRRVRAGRKGEATLAVLAPEDWTAAALAEGPRFGASVVLTASTKATELVMPAIGSLRVACVDAAGAPVAHAIVLSGAMRLAALPPGLSISVDARRAADMVRPGPWSSYVVGFADASGVATLTGLPAGPCTQLVARRPGFAPRETDCLSVPAGGRADARVVLEPAATLRAVVLAPEGNPLPGATVVVSSDPSKSEKPDAQRGRGPSKRVPFAVTGEQGEVLVRDLAAGRWSVRAGARGYLPSEQVMVELAAAGDAAVELPLGVAATLAGRVVDAAGSAASGATVRLEHDRSSPASYLWPVAPQPAMGDDGSFVVEGLYPDLPLTLTASRGGELSPPKRAVPGQGPVTLALVSRGAVSGTVTRDGRPVREAQVGCEMGQERSPSTSSLDDGSFELSGLAPGAWTCTAKSSDFGLGRQRDVMVERGATAHVTLALSDGRAVELRVVDADTEAPVAGARITGGLEEKRTDESGVAEVQLAPWGDRNPLSIQAEGYGWANRPPPPPPQSSLEIRLARRPSVKGRVLDAAGEPAPGARVNGTQANAEGRFEIANVTTGPLRLNASRIVGSERQEATLLVEVPREGLDDVTLGLVPAPTGGVRVRVANGDAPVGGASVRLVSSVQGDDATRFGMTNMWYSSGFGRDDQASGSTDPAGLFVAEGLVPGGYAILVGLQGDVVLGRAGSVNIVADQVADVTVEPPAGHVVRGRVMRGGSPVEAASIAIAPGSGTPWYSTRGLRTEADGTFATTPLPRSMRSVRLTVAPPEPRLPDDVTSLVRVVELDAEPPELVLDLTGVSVTGVVSSEGLPVEDAAIELKVDGSTIGFGTPSWRARTATDGTFTVRGLPPQADVTLVASKPPLEAHAQRLALPASGALGPLALELGGSGGLRGTATSSAGPIRFPLSLALVAADGARQHLDSVMPDAAGAFVLPVRGDAAYTYRATTQGFAPLLGSVSPGQPLALAFTPGARLDLRVKGPDGEAVEGASVRVVSHEGRAADDFLVPSSLSDGWLALASDFTGRVQLPFLPPGALVLRVEKGELSAETAVTLQEGRETTAEARLAN